MNKKIKLYIIGGVASVLLDLVLLYVFFDITGISLYFSSIIAFVGSSIFGFLYHRNISFSGDKNSNYLKQFLVFITVNSISQIIYMIILYIGVDVLFLYYLYVAIGGKLLIFIINYSLHNKITFQKSMYQYISSITLISIIIVGYILTIVTKDIGNKGTEKMFEGTTWYQIIPDKFDNGNINNDFNTAPLDWASASGTILRQYETYRNSRTGDWYPLNTGELLVYNELTQNKQRDKKIAQSYIYKFRWYGGDFTGIRNRIGYLKDLGVEGIFLNPIWIAASPMRYDVVDYRHIDPRLSDTSGTTGFNDISDLGWEWSEADKDFHQLVEEFHNNGMKVIIDLAFTYSSAKSIFLEDIARKGRNSEYYSRFELYYTGDVDYNEKTCRLSDFRSGEIYQEAQNIRMNGRWGHCPMVYVNRSHNGSIHADLEAWYKAIVSRWISPQIIDGKEFSGVDGIRLDAVHELPKVLRKNIYDYVKSIKPQATIIGEEWNNDFSLISRKELDGYTNYLTRTLGELFMIGKENAYISGSEWHTLLTQEYKGKNRKYWRNSWNQLGSHDTDRVFSKTNFTNRKQNILNGAKISTMNIKLTGHYLRDRPNINKLEYGANYLSNKPHDSDIPLRKSLTMLQFMLPGAPMIYYGDEVGMRGADDPDNRKPMWRTNYTYIPETICVANPESYCKITNTSDNRAINTDILDLYKKLISIRKNSNALQKGILYTSIGIDKNAEDGILSFGRRYGQENVLFISNQSSTYEKQLVTIQTLPFSTMFNPLNNKTYKANIIGKIQISIDPEDSVILVDK